MDKIQWLAWSPEVFQQAKREDKLILLDIGAGWCHWCHVMDEESYGNPEIINTIKQHYVPVRVDYDERPDINDRYNQGGWPTTVILTHEGFVVHGATYLPAPTMKELLKQARQWYEENKSRISEAAKLMAAEAQREQPTPAAPEPQPAKDFTARIVEDMMKNADRVHGGFGTGAKFPQPGAISLAFAQFYRAAEPELLEFAETTLRNMSEGLLDKEQGGMFRYSVTPEWDTPHYEKNLNVNAESLQNYLDAYRLTRKKEFADAAENIIRYVRTKMTDPAGGFYGSQDADIFDEDSLQIVMEGEAYYKLSAAERQKYGEPAIDKTLYVNWNSLMVSALLDASHVLENTDYRDIALKALHRLMQECVGPETGACHYLRDGEKSLGFLGDTVALARANLDAYETTADTRLLENARTLMETARRRYAAADGGFYDSVGEEGMPPAISIRHKPIADNLLAIEVLGRLYNYTAESSYLTLAAATLLAFEQNVEALLLKEAGYFAADYALATQYVDESSTKVAIIGPADDERSLKLLREAKRLYRPAKIVQLIDPSRDMSLIRTMRYPVEEHLPVVHICTEKGCAAPVKSVEEMMELLVS